MPVGAPAAALFAGAYVQAAIGGGASTLMLTAVTLIVGITLINAFGVTVSGRMQLGVAALFALIFDILLLATTRC